MSKRDPGFSVPVNGVSEADLAVKVTASLRDVVKHFPPKTGVCVFVFDFGEGGGMAYAANARRADMIRALREFLERQESPS